MQHCICSPNPTTLDALSTQHREWKPNVHCQLMSPGGGCCHLDTCSQGPGLRPSCSSFQLTDVQHPDNFHSLQNWKDIKLVTYMQKSLIPLTHKTLHLLWMKMELNLKKDFRWKSLLKINTPSGMKELFSPFKSWLIRAIFILLKYTTIKLTGV